MLQFHLCHSVNIYSNWLQEQFCNLSLYTLKEEALDRTMWRNRFGRDFGPAVWQITDDDDDDDDDTMYILSVQKNLLKQEMWFTACIPLFVNSRVSQQVILRRYYSLWFFLLRG